MGKTQLVIEYAHLFGGRTSWCGGPTRLHRPALPALRMTVQLRGGDPGEFVDRYLRLTWRSRAAMERMLDA